MLKQLLLISMLFINLAANSQEDQHTWTDGKFMTCTAGQTVRLEKDVTILIVDCREGGDGYITTIKNNKQLQEIILNDAGQKDIDALFGLTDSKIEVVSFNQIAGESLAIPVCRIGTLTQLNMESFAAKSLSFADNAFSNLNILQITMDELTSWKQFSSQSVGLIDISCLKLQQLPSLKTPELYQYSVFSSAPFPTDICNMPELTLVHIGTTIEGKLSECHKELLKRDGLIEFASFSDDEEKRISVKSQAYLDFEKEMEEEAAKMQENIEKD